MNPKHKAIWKLAKPYLKKSKKKDFVLHTKGVIKAVKLLLEKEGGDKETVIPAAILHDVGWAKVPMKLQKSNGKKEAIRALKFHIQYAPFIINGILAKLRYGKNQIKKIIEIVTAHKFKSPRELNKRLLIDADTLSDIFKEQFFSDAKKYKNTPDKHYNFRKNNKFYTKTAEIIFKKELKKRKKEIASQNKDKISRKNND